ncbi:type II secretion system minor pseudopilin GspK [Caldimonas tepidiphila]|uniref:type II secretion system minor pseudopilin GspK n=1 Tax=Caldimonas tepidiphila TaxID=2315841 RepID=UPI000E5BC1CF|nr:type II secretion system minor pseudopilin GspK [Caldimonas tepidiphila]
MTRPPSGRSRPLRQRGAALLTAMVIVTLVATLSAGMMWRQWRAVQIEAAERSRVQSGWMLSGALDWARLILREDNKGIDHLGEPWAVPLAEARLSTFLAADRDNTQDAPDAFLSGAIVDLQSRFNLNNLVRNGEISERDLGALRRLVEQLGLAPSVADRLAVELQRATPAAPGSNSGGGEAGTQRGSGSGDGGDAALLPTRLEDLGWLGLDAPTLERLAPHVALLPARTRINLNTASREVIAAGIEGLDLASAERLVQQRQRSPFRNVSEVIPLLGNAVQPDPELVGVESSFFEVRGRMRIAERAVEERSLVHRRGREVVTLQRQRVNLSEGGGLLRP